jgi:hypothetical protein
MLIYDQTCAAESAAAARESEFVDPPKRIFIHQRGGLAAAIAASVELSVRGARETTSAAVAIGQSSLQQGIFPASMVCPSFVLRTARS